MKLFAVVLTLTLALPLLAAQGKPFEPIPEAEKALWRFDLTKNFYANEAAWKADCDKILALTARIEAFRGKVIQSPEYLLDVLSARKELTDALYKLYGYGEFRVAIDTGDRVAFETYERLKAESDARTSFVRVELKALSADTFSAFLNQKVELQPYRYILEDAMRQAPHTLTEGRESVLAAMGPNLTSWQEVLFYRAFDRTAFPKVRVDGKELDVNLDFAALQQNPDRAVRSKAFREYYATLDKISDLAGFSLLRLMQNYNDQAKLRGFDTYYNQSLFDRYLTRPQADNLYAQLEAQIPIYQAFQGFRMDEVKAQLKVPQAQIWDMEIPAKGATPPRFSADEGSKAVVDGLSVLGPEYGGALAGLLDPRNGRMDIVGGPHRQQGAFCEANLGFFMQNYQGYMDDVATMAHEAGHAMHAQLVLNHQGSLLFTEGPGYMTESFATFNEWLLRDHLMATTKDPEVRKVLKRSELNDMMLLWELARRAKFEMVAYDRVAAGQIADEKGFDQACMDTGTPYDIFFSKYPEMMKVHWMRKHHYWSVPTYYVNYVVAQVLALKYYELYKADPAGFPAKYTALVAAGFERPAAEQLKHYVGIDLSDPKLLQGTFDLIQRTFDEVKKER